MCSKTSFIKTCAPKHPYNTKTHLAQELCSPPLNGLEGVPQPRPLPHLHPLPTWHIHILQVLFLNASDFSPCEGDSEEVRPLRPGPKRLPPEKRCLYYQIPGAQTGPSGLSNVCQVLRSEQQTFIHTQLGGARG